jgi:polar amino acid transport system substrate-binding protein
MMRTTLLLLASLLSSFISATTLVVGMEDANSPPFEYIDDKGQLSGFHVDVLRAVTARLGWQVRFDRSPWKRAMLRLEHGDLQAVSYVAKSAEREVFALFLPDNQLHISRPAFFIRRSRAGEIHFLPDMEQMARRWRIAIPSGYYISDEIQALIKRGVPITQPTVSENQLLRMLMANRFDATLLFSTSLQTAKTEIANIDEEVQRLDSPPMPGSPRYIAFSRKAPQMAADFAEAFRQFRQEPGYLALAEHFGVTELLPKPDEIK